MSRNIKLAACLLSIAALAGCGDDKPQNNENHVWKAQTDTLNQAQQAADEMSKSIQQQGKQLESDLKQ